MSQHTVTTRMSRAKVMAALTALPQEMTGAGSAARDLLTRVGLAMLRRIHGAFLVKMRGGTDEAGDRWAPLSPVTIAMRLRRRGIGSPKKRSRAKRKVVLSGDISPAHQRARAIIRSAGARYDKYGRDAEILHDTGRLLLSLTPGSNSAEQVLEVSAGRVIVGTNREGAKANHEGRPPKLPQRRLWPDPSDWPPEWWDQILTEVQDGVVDMVAQQVQ